MSLLGIIKFRSSWKFERIVGNINLSFTFSETTQEIGISNECFLHRNMYHIHKKERTRPQIEIESEFAILLS